MKILKIILKITYNLLFVLLLISATFILLTTYNVIPKYNFYVVMSGSMEPSIHTGSVVGIKQEQTYQLQDVITVKMKNDPSQSYTHRIVEKLQEDSITYKTKGDANESIDPDPVSENSVLGKVFISVPLIGYLVNFAKQPTGFILMIIVPSVIIAASEINIIKEETTKFIQAKKQQKEDSIKEGETQKKKVKSKKKKK
ncbi:MAG: signal peptidase I [Candidatus Dojkabacteria bacterium]